MGGVCAGLVPGGINRPPAVVGFYAMAQPNLETALEMANRRQADRVVVQPHLLFQGELLNKIRQRVAAWANGEGSGKRWSITEHLGPDEILARQIGERYHEAASRFST